MRILFRCRRVLRFEESTRYGSPPRGNFLHHFGARQAQERANDFAFEHGIDSPQAPRPRASQQPHQHGFRLIVGGVRGGHAVQPALVNQGEEETVAQIARHGFQIAAALPRHPPHIRLAPQIFNLEGCGKPAHQSFVTVGLRPAQAMIKVYRRERQPRFARERVHEVQKQNRVRPARNRHPHALASVKEFLAAHFERPTSV